MSLAENFESFRTLLARQGVGAAMAKAFDVVRDQVKPPLQTMLWLRASEVARVPLPEGARFQVTHSLADVSGIDRDATTASIGSDSVTIWNERFRAGLEAHLLFLDGRLAASRFVIWGRVRPFHHVVLTPNDAMSMDLRVDPSFRGRGLAPAFFSRSVLDLAERGCERMYVSVAVNNTPAIKTFERLGFKPIVRWRQRAQNYRFETAPLR